MLAESDAKAPRLRHLTMMLTETCNLDCWMCDFARSKGLTKALPLKPDEIVKLLAHPVFAKSLRTLTLTGGEPFAYSGIGELYRALRHAYPALRVNFSTNGTLLPKMLPVLDQVDNWKRIGVLMSVDGITKHDLQRGTEGSFAKTVATLTQLRSRYPQLSLTIKFTITPLNYEEVEATYTYFASRGYRFTVKMLENNPHYTNKLSAASHVNDFSFSHEQIEAIAKQLRSILSKRSTRMNAMRRKEVGEVLASLVPAWTRNGKCTTPEKAAFIDCDLNMFTCKEYPPVLNLGTDSLDHLDRMPMFQHVRGCELTNTEKCTHCTSQMKREPVTITWLRYIASFVH